MADLMFLVRFVTREESGNRDVVMPARRRCIVRLESIRTMEIGILIRHSMSAGKRSGRIHRYEHHSQNMSGLFSWGTVGAKSA